MNSILQNIQGLRALAVLAVMVFHLHNIEQRYSTDTLLPGWLHLGAAGVDLFFLISGFIMVTVTQGQLPGWRNTGRFLLQRAIRIYPLYWIISAVVLAVFWISPALMRPLPERGDFLLKSFLLLPQPDLPLLSVGWTLVHELHFYAVFALLLCCPLRWRPWLLGLWPVLALAAWWWLAPTQETQPWLYLASNPLSLEFVAGCVVALAVRDRTVPAPALLCWAGVATAAAGWWAWTVLSGSADFPPVGWRVALFLLPAALLLAGAVGLEQRGRLCGRWWQRIGDASYSLYLTHILLLSAGGRVWQRWGLPDSPLDNLLWLPGLFLATLTGGLLCHALLEKPLLAWLRRWVPRR